MESILSSAFQLAQQHHSQYDPSHDIAHVLRVKNLSLSIANSITAPIDKTVIELSSLFHDLLDSKYLNGKETTARDYLSSFWLESDGFNTLSEERRRLVELIIENVSYSKEIKRNSVSDETEWHQNCLELHCVQDADKLDAIGCIGILRCAAFSGAKNIPLLSTPTSNSNQITISSSKSSAIDHFSEKLLNLESMMKTEKGKALAIKRTAFLKLFLEENSREAEEHT